MEMTVNTAMHILLTEKKLNRTPCKRPLTDYAIKCLDASIGDKNNQDVAVVQCVSCGMVVSSLLVENGCPNCGGLDLSQNIQNVEE